MTEEAATSEELRNRLVDQIVADRPLAPRVEHALRTVRREDNLPGIDLPTAYTDQAVSIKENPSGPLPLSCASVPSMVAMMLDQLDVKAGDNILEIGAGTGYNAALLDELTGPEGHVTTVDIDEDVALHARTTLNRSGHDRVRVFERDGLIGVPEHGPYTRLIGTVGLWDFPNAWWDQLADDARVVLPLRWRGQTRSIALTRHGNTLTADSVELCGFVPVIGQDGEKTAALNTEDTVRIHYDQDQDIDPAAFDESTFSIPCTTTLSEQRIGGEESFDGVWLRATASDNRVCRVEVTPKALESGVRRPSIPMRSPALVSGGSIAYLITEREEADPQRPFRLGAAAYGPDRDSLAQDLVAHINTWGAYRAAIPEINISALADPAPDTGFTITKSESRLTLNYP
ncbi:methyltransferase, FxLD system [Streptomyces cavernicola]|uniref:Protein-L-isoaspartate O-methyltransferase n=1 Tax=Streptomyces cavernicola TaxID=3043613 RepID=A0ABT6SNM8_9ACTN|nr:methyltransferase, FxLD system [Streptomyces sp. B-S-A6]MDI3409449.1 methyltransferase, FxLD system [Streptomyces sp. B-S-A6]